MRIDKNFVGNYFITPHAMRQFQRRIARLSDHETRVLIVRGIQSTPVNQWRVTQNGAAVCVRVRSPLQFRAILQPGEKGLPAVVTILRSGNTGRNRKLRKEYRPIYE